MPSLTIAVQSEGRAQATLVTASAPGGAVAGDHVVPASLVVTTTPLPGRDAPFEPTAMHSTAEGHETPLSWGVLPPTTCCAFHEMPPSVVAMITVVPPRRSGIGSRHAHGPTTTGAGAGHRTELTGTARRRLPHHQGCALGFTEDAGGRS